MLKKVIKKALKLLKLKGHRKKLWKNIMQIHDKV